jgi:transposase
MFKIPKQEYPPEFRALSVKRVQGGEGIAKVARELGLVEQTLRNWVKAAKAGKLNPPWTKPVTPEQMELSRVRAELARLKMEWRTPGPVPAWGCTQTTRGCADIPGSASKARGPGHRQWCEDFHPAPRPDRDNHARAASDGHTLGSWQHLLGLGNNNPKCCTLSLRSRFPRSSFR